MAGKLRVVERCVEDFGQKMPQNAGPPSQAKLNAVRAKAAAAGYPSEAVSAEELNEIQQRMRGGSEGASEAAAAASPEQLTIEVNIRKLQKKNKKRKIRGVWKLSFGQQC